MITPAGGIEQRDQRRHAGGLFQRACAGPPPGERLAPLGNHGPGNRSWPPIYHHEKRMNTAFYAFVRVRILCEAATRPSARPTAVSGFIGLSP
jgi:hypothetical protein